MQLKTKHKSANRKDKVNYITKTWHFKSFLGRYSWHLMTFIQLLQSNPWFQASFFDRLHHLLHFRRSGPSRPSRPRSWGHLMLFCISRPAIFCDKEYWKTLKNSKDIYECFDSPLLPTRELLDPVHVLKWFDLQIRMAQRQAPRHLQRQQWFWDV